MAQRVDQLFQVFYGAEAGTEGVDPTTPALGTATEALLVTNLAFTPDVATIIRRFKGNMGYSTARIGDQPDPGLSFTTELRNRGVTNNVSDIDELLRVVLGGRLPVTAGQADSGSTTIASATDGANFVLTSGTNFATGQGLIVDMNGSGFYEAGIIKSLAGATVVLQQALSATPTVARAVKSMVTFNAADSGHQSLSFQIWLDATTYVSFVGCKGNAVIQVPSVGAIPTVKWTFKAIAWDFKTGGGRPAMTIGDVDPSPVALGSTFKSDAVKTDIRAFELDLGNQLARKRSQNATYGSFSIVVADRTPKGKFSLYNSDQSNFTDWFGNPESTKSPTVRGISHQFNTALNKIVHVCCPKAQKTKVALGSDSGLTTDEVEFQPNFTSGADDVYIAFG